MASESRRFVKRADRDRLDKLDGAADILTRLLAGVQRGEIEATPSEQTRLAALVSALREVSAPRS